MIDIYSPDYDTTETVVCSSKFLYNAKRQRSLAHYISIEPLPQQYKVVDLPSGHYAACGFQVNLQRKQMQYQIQVTGTLTLMSASLHAEPRCTCRASCSW